MKGKIFLASLIGIFLIVGGVFALEFGTGIFKIRGTFSGPNGWSGDTDERHTEYDSTPWGYPWRVLFASGTAQDPYITSSGYIHGVLWIGNAGWASFDHGNTDDGWIWIPKVNCPDDILIKSTQTCPITGAVWNSNIWWIVMNNNTNQVGSGVYYNPNSGNIEGWGWNRELWWVPFWSNLKIVDKEKLPTWTLNGSPIVWWPDDGTITAANVRFVGKIAIIGNIAGSRVFSVENIDGVYDQDMRNAFNSINQSEIFNTIHKNIALMTRNVKRSDLYDKSSYLDFIIPTAGDNPADYVIDGTWNTAYNLNYNQDGKVFKKSVIVQWKDVILDKDYINMSWAEWANDPFALIVLKDQAGKWGNVIVTDKVKWIHAYIYAEGSIFSAKKPAPSTPFNPQSDSYMTKWEWNIPQNQLYIRGSVISKNTVGGSQQKPKPICPVFVDICTDKTAIPYDWNYFRTYDSEEISQRSIPIQRWDKFPENVQKATMIIEYDQKLMTDPPPGFRLETN